MLDKAEDPEKLIKLMIHEMEDTLVELKASCAGTMATRARVSRALGEAGEKVNKWSSNAKLAIEKGRDDLAREALMEKRVFQDQADALESEATELSGLIDQYQKDIEQLEEKLENTRKKHRVLVERHIHAEKRTKAQKRIRTAETSDAFLRFQKFESKIDRMEADADLVIPVQRKTLADEIEGLETDDDIEKELADLKASSGSVSSVTGTVSDS